MSTKTFVYTELQLAMPFADAPWAEINQSLWQQPGIQNKTWLAGVKTNTLGGFYEFADSASALAFVNGYFPQEAAKFGAHPNTKLFVGSEVEAASRDLDSVHFGQPAKARPGAYVYTEVQTRLPFAEVPWQKLNGIFREQPGILSKTWLSGYQTQTVGGFYSFDTIENAQKYGFELFPKIAQDLQSAFMVKVFDARPTEEASKEMKSPFWKV